MNYNRTFIIETPRLQLVCCNLEIIEALFEGDAALGRLLGVNIPGTWTEFGEPAFRWTYDRLRAGTGIMEWLSYLPILRKENMLAGSCGYKGDPVNGKVEIGYEVAVDYRGNGYATEIAAHLIKNAFLDDTVTIVQAHTLAEENESGSVLLKCGMKKMEEIEDPDDGTIWRWEILR